MRKLFTGVLIANLLFEGWIGLILLFKISPDDSDPLGVHTAWATDYAFAALVIASLAFWVWKNRYQRNIARLTLGILSSFHLLLAISTGMAVADGDPLAAPIIHASLALLSITLFATQKQWADDLA